MIWWKVASQNAVVIDAIDTNEIENLVVEQNWRAPVYRLNPMQIENDRR